MTDREKVMKGLKCCSGANRVCMYVRTANECPYAELIEEDWYGGDSNVECTKALAADALELLKLQEPKPVIVKTSAYDYRFYFCPKCGGWFEYAYRKPNYCDRCGQEVKWDG